MSFLSQMSLIRKLQRRMMLIQVKLAKKKKSVESFSYSFAHDVNPNEKCPNEGKKPSLIREEETRFTPSLFYIVGSSFRIVAHRSNLLTPSRSALIRKKETRCRADGLASLLLLRFAQIESLFSSVPLVTSPKSNLSPLPDLRVARR